VTSLKWRAIEFVGIVGSVLEKRLLKMTGGSTTMKNDGLHNKSFLKKKTAIHLHFVQNPVWVCKVMQVVIVNFTVRKMGWHEVENRVELNRPQSGRWMTIALMLMLLMSPKVNSQNLLV